MNLMNLKSPNSSVILVFRDSEKCSSNISLRSAPITSSNDKTIEPSGGPNSFRASWKTFSRFSESTLCTSTSSMAKMGLWSDCLSSALPYHLLVPADHPGTGSFDNCLLLHKTLSVQAGTRHFSEVS